MIEVKITVVRHEGELLFDFSGVKFDILKAEFFYSPEAKKLVIRRGDEVIDRTTEIREVGGHGAFLAFVGLKRLFEKDCNRANYTGHLFPEDLREGDTILLELEAPDTFDFGSFLKRHARELSVLLEIFKKHPGESLPVSEVDREMLEVLKKTPPPSDVIRFKNI